VATHQLLGQELLARIIHERAVNNPGLLERPISQYREEVKGPGVHCAVSRSPILVRSALGADAYGFPFSPRYSRVFFANNAG
jgi:hypothetical protein